VPSKILAWLAAAVVASGLGAPVPAGEIPCPEQFADGTAPLLANPRLARQVEPLCFRSFAVLHSGVTRTPLYSAEHLTADSTRAARHLRRVNLFHAEERLPAAQRAELWDYARSGYDRGHMAPSGDMPDAQAQAESFSLANMVPQAPQLNRGVWEGIERAVRDLSQRDGSIYVVTGPLFQGDQLQALNGRVLVPSDTFKALYDPAIRGAGAYLCTNTNDPECREVSIAELKRLSGIDVFPSLSEATKAAAIPLPEPEPRGERGYHRRQSISPSWESGAWNRSSRSRMTRRPSVSAN
jgi:endonuclease G